MSAVDWAYDAATQRTVSPAFPFDPAEVLFWQATTDAAIVSKLARYRGAATTFSADGRLGIGFVPGGGPDYAYLLTGFDLDSNRAVWTIRHEGSSPPVAIFSPDGHWVAIASWKATRILDARTGAPAATWLVHAEIGVSVAFSRDSRRVVVSLQGQARVFEAPEWRLVAEYSTPDQHSIQGVVFTPDSTRAILVTDQAIHVWNASGGQAARRFSMDGARPLQTLAISPQGRWLVAGTPGIPPGLSPETEPLATVFAWPMSGGETPRSLWAEGDVSILAWRSAPTKGE